MGTNYIEDYKEAVQLAIERESEAERFYDKFAENVHEPDAKSLLKRLAIEEKKHQKLLHAFSGEVKTVPEGAFIPPENFAYDFSEQNIKTTEDYLKQPFSRKKCPSIFMHACWFIFLAPGTKNCLEKFLTWRLTTRSSLSGI